MSDAAQFKMASEGGYPAWLEWASQAEGWVNKNIPERKQYAFWRWTALGFDAGFQAGKDYK